MKSYNILSLAIYFLTFSRARERKLKGWKCVLKASLRTHILLFLIEEAWKLQKITDVCPCYNLKSPRYCPRYIFVAIEWL